MAKYRKYISALKQCAKEHEYDITHFANIRTTNLCNDTADLLERLEIGINKAIDEMNNIDLNEYADNSYQLVNECIEILKRNIGE